MSEKLYFVVFRLKTGTELTFDNFEEYWGKNWIELLGVLDDADKVKRLANGEGPCFDHQ